MRLFRAAVLTALSVACLTSQTLPAGVQKVTSVEGITEYAWPNGLHVLLFPDESRPKVTVNITYLVGSRHEGNGETGMAHLMEHMLFLQSKTGRDVKKELTDHGAQWNGTTWYDRTNYFEVVNASDDNLRWAIGLEADRMTNMRIEKELLDKEMTVVRNEFEMGENSPFNVLNERTLEAAYIFHPYGKPTIGSRSDIERVPIDRLDAFYHKFYQPDNAVLMIAGNFDETKALQMVATAFGSLPKPQRVLPKTYTVEPVQDGERQVTLRRVGDNQAIMVVYHIPASTHPDTAALNVLSMVLGDTPSGRLYKALVENKKAVAAGAGEQLLHDPGFFMARVILREDQSLDQAREALLKTIDGVAAEPPSKEEVDRAKNRILKEFDLELTNSEDIGLDMSEYTASGDWRLFFLGRDRIKSVTPEDVARVARAYLKESNRTVGVFIPTKTPDRAEVPATPDPGEVLKDFKGGAPMAKGEVFSSAPGTIETRVVRATLPVGLRMALLPKKNRGGEVVANIRLEFGDAQAVMGRTFAGNIAGAMLMRGTRHKTRQQIQDELDRLKAQASAGGNAVSANAFIETTEENLPGVLRLMAEVLREPAFPQNEFDQLIQQMLASVESSRKEPQFLASNQLSRLMNPYPRGHYRYVSTPDEQMEDLKKVTLDQVRRFHQDFYGVSNASVTVSGQFDAAVIQKLITDLFGDWKSPMKFTMVPQPNFKLTPFNGKIETPDKQNSLFIAGLRFPMSDNDPDYPAMVVANYIFGGSTASRLWKRIRDKEGYSYGVNTSFYAPEVENGNGGTLMMNAICAPQNAPKVEAVFKEELERALKEGFTAQEVTEGRKAWVDQRTVQRAEDGSLAGMLLQRLRFGRTLKWDEALETKIMAVTPDEVNAAFRRHIDPAGFLFVKAGDFDRAGAYK